MSLTSGIIVVLRFVCAAHRLREHPFLHADCGSGERGHAGPRHPLASSVHGNRLCSNPGSEREPGVSPKPEIHATGGGSVGRVHAHHFHCAGPRPLHETNYQVRNSWKLFRNLSFVPVRSNYSTKTILQYIITVCNATINCWAGLSRDVNVCVNAFW